MCHTLGSIRVPALTIPARSALTLPRGLCVSTPPLHPTPIPQPTRILRIILHSEIRTARWERGQAGQAPGSQGVEAKTWGGGG